MNYLNNEKTWKQTINSLETNFDNLETNKQRAIIILKDKIKEIIKKRQNNLLFLFCLCYEKFSF